MRALWLVAFLLFASCMDDSTQVAGGSAVEGETVTARIIDSRGIPLAGTTVSIRSADSSWSIETVSNSSGVVVFKAPAGADELFLSVACPDSTGQILTFRIILHPSLDTTLVLQRWGALTGKATAPEGWTARSIFSPGLDLSTAIDGGQFSFEHVRPGSWPFNLMADSAGIADTFDLGDVDMPANGMDVHREFTIRSNVYLTASFDDAPTQKTTCVEDGPDAGVLLRRSAGCASVATGSSAWSGSSLRLDLHGTSDTLHAILVYPDADSQGGFMAAPTDTLAFMARGTGLLEIFVGLASGDTLTYVGTTSTKALLQSTWTRHRMPLRDMLPAGTELATVRWIAFGAHEQAWAVLDELYLAAIRP